MNELNPTRDASSEVNRLEAQLNFLKLVLIVIGGTLAAYLYYQSHIIGKEVDALRPQAQPIIQSFQQNQKLMQNFMNQLSAYAVTHPDFQPILKKYGWNPAASNAAPVKKK